MLEGGNESQQEEQDNEDYTDEEEFKGFDNIMDDDDEEEEEENSSDDEFIANFVQGLQTKKRTRKDQDEPKKRLKERNEAYKENEFNLTTHEDKDDQKISLEDLMSTVQNEAGLGSLKEGVETLVGKGKHMTRRALDAPLAKRVQDRMERQVASATANEEISKWQPTVQMNRRAEHLSFPLREESPYAKDGGTSASMANKFKAETTLEKQISEALASAGMKDEELEAFEALKLNKLSVEEVAERRKELRMMRELMFRHEIKNKRLKKIKSKSYRKLKRLEKGKLDSQVKEDNLEHDMEEGDEKMQSAMSRAEERMTLKHKNTSQWAKRALARGGQDEGTREAIMEQLRRGEELKKKMDGSESESEDDDRSISEQIGDLKRDIEEDTQPKKGLLSMKFMQDAAKRQEGATLNEIEAFEKEWLAPESDKEENDNSAIISNNPGRMAFGAKAKKPTKKVVENTAVVSDSEDAKPVVEKEETEIKVVEEDESKNTKKKNKKKNKNKKMKITADIESNGKAESNGKTENNTEEDDSSALMVHKSNMTFNQRELVARAFANDDVVAEFEEEKLAEIAEDGDKEEDLTLPGWGSWGGSGVKVKKNKKKIIKVTKGLAAEKRRDAKLARVIISEKANAKTDKYQATGVPFPFKTIEQYERSLNTPVGKEWNTSQTFSKMTKPRVLTKLGKVIDPLSVPFL